MGHEDEGVRRRGNPTGPSAANVAANVRALRGGQSLRGLSARLSEIGHPLAASALQRIESGERRVDVDDLTALACALNVSPIALLKVPEGGSGRLTGTQKLSTRELTLWLQGLEPLPEQRVHLLTMADSFDEGTLARWIVERSARQASLDDASEELVSRIFFDSRQGLYLGIGWLWVRMTAGDAAVYVINDAGEVLFQLPDDAPGIKVRVLHAEDSDGLASTPNAGPALDRMQNQIDALRDIVLKAVRDMGSEDEHGDN